MRPAMTDTNQRDPDQPDPDQPDPDQPDQAPSSGDVTAGRTPTEDHLREPGADRMPTTDEARAAERAATEVDVDQVAEHYEEMTERRSKVRGEGQIEPGTA